VISIQQAPVLRLTLASRARAPLRSFTGLSIHQLSMGTRVLSIVGALYQWSRETDVENNEEMQSPNGDARFLSSSAVHKSLSAWVADDINEVQCSCRLTLRGSKRRPVGSNSRDKNSTV
jgi:hypothetical protein